MTTVGEIQAKFNRLREMHRLAGSPIKRTNDEAVLTELYEISLFLAEGFLSDISRIAYAMEQIEINTRNVSENGWSGK